MKIFARILAAILVMAAGVFVSEAGDDNALIERLISGSPWMGKMQLIVDEVNVQIIFTRTKDGGIAAGRFGNGDPLLYLKVKNGKVMFTTVKRVAYVLTLEDGILSGLGYTEYKLKPLSVKLYPSH